MSIINSQPRIGAAGQSTGFKIERSLRFNSADSAYLNRTPASAGNRRTWTWSGWVKLSESSTGVLFAAEDAAGNASPYTAIYYINNRLELQRWGGSSYNIQVSTNNLLRDFSAWYHFVVAVDTTQATSANRVKLYINGVETSYNTATYPTQNFDTDVNFTQRHALGCLVRVSPNNFTGFSNQYLTEVNFIDGSTPTTTTRTVGGVTETVLTQFGEFDTDTGVWKPKAYSGSYGTNGFYLKFADNSGTTSTTLGKDSSGNGNNWTPNNFYVGPGTTNAEKAGIDSLVDTPTPYGTDTGAGGEVRGNYCTLNPLNNPGGSTFANGNLDVTTASSTGGRVVGTVGVSSGKWYWEITPTSVAGQSLIGIAAASRVSSGGVGDFSDDYAYQNNGNKYSNSVGAAYGASYVANDVIGVALDLDAGTLVFYKNNSSQGTAYSSISGTFVPAMSDGQNANSSAFVCNFGQRPFAYTAPSGFKALCTQNLPTPTIGATSATRANKYFDVVLRTSNGNVGGTYSTTVNMSNGAWMWDKGRSINSDHYLLDSVRGISKTLSSNTIGAEANYPNWFTNFGSSSFTTGSDDYTAGTTVVDWIWSANGSGSSNTAGSITSTVSANTTAGFSIVTWTGNSSNATIGHGLGVAPSMYIIKYRGTTDSWYAYHTRTGAGQYLVLNGTDAAAANTNIWQNTAPTSTVFSIGFSNNASTIVAYCFAPVAGYSAFGSYTGNGSSDGPFVYTGFRPRYVMLKASSRVESWYLFDTARNPYNVADNRLYANTSGAEGTGGSYGPDILSNGFKLRTSDSGFNFSGATYVYACFAEVPQKFSLGR